MCGGINPYTLTARIGPARTRGSGPLEDDYSCARGLSRPPSCSGTVQTTLVLGDCLDHSLTTARGLHRSLLDLCSGTASTTLRPRLGDFVARSSTCSRGLLDHSLTMARGLCVSITCDWRLAYSWDIFSSFDLATRLISRLLASSGTTSVRCTCRCISYRLYDD